MAENSEVTQISEADKLETITLLPRSAWNSQLTYLKVVLKTKQSLDKNEQLPEY